MATAWLAQVELFVCSQKRRHGAESFNVLERWKKLQDSGEWRVGAPTQRAGLGIALSHFHRIGDRVERQRDERSKPQSHSFGFRSSDPGFCASWFRSRPWASPSAALIGVELQTAEELDV